MPTSTANAKHAGKQFPDYCRFILANAGRGWTGAEMIRRFIADQRRIGMVPPGERTLEVWTYEGVIFGPGDTVVTAFEAVQRIKDGVWAEDLIGDTQKILQDKMYSLLMMGIDELRHLMTLDGTRKYMEREPSLGLRFATKITELDKRVKQYAGQTSIKRAEDAAAVIASLLEKFPELAEPVHMLTETMVKGDVSQD